MMAIGSYPDNKHVDKKKKKKKEKGWTPILVIFYQHITVFFLFKITG